MKTHYDPNLYSEAMFLYSEEMANNSFLPSGLLKKVTMASRCVPTRWQETEVQGGEASSCLAVIRIRIHRPLPTAIRLGKSAVPTRGLNWTPGYFSPLVGDRAERGDMELRDYQVLLAITLYLESCLLGSISQLWPQALPMFFDH